MDVSRVAVLANIPISGQEESKFSQQFAETLTTVELINELNTKNVILTSQVTGFTNHMRPDRIDKSRILTQVEALSNASHTYQGYFVVPAIFE